MRGENNENMSSSFVSMLSLQWQLDDKDVVNGVHLTRNTEGLVAPKRLEDPPFKSTCEASAPDTLQNSFSIVWSRVSSLISRLQEQL